MFSMRPYHQLIERVDPMSLSGNDGDKRKNMSRKIAFLFPGQGAQTVGMGADLITSTEIGRVRMEQANDIARFDLRDLILNGPIETLSRTEKTQPALFAVCAIIHEVLKDRLAISPALLAGHSVGEIAACHAAGSISFADGLAIALRRGELMASATPDEGRYGMTAIIGLDSDLIKSELARFDGEVSAANFNSPEQTVIAGRKDHMARFAAIAQERGAKKIVELAVSSAFHTALMSQAGAKLGSFLDGIEISAPEIDIIRNVDARISKTADEVKIGLTEQVARAVLWLDSMRLMSSSGAQVALELGPGKVLVSLLKRIDKKIDAVAINRLEDIERLERDRSILEDRQGDE